LKFDFTFSTKESETEIDIQNINQYFVSEPQKVSNQCLSSTKEPEVTNERIGSHLNSDFTLNNYFDFRDMSQNDLREALNGMQSMNDCKNLCQTHIITNKMLKLIGPLIIPDILALINLVIKTSKLLTIGRHRKCSLSIKFLEKRIIFQTIDQFDGCHHSVNYLRNIFLELCANF
jgi:hypothetical protein